MSQTQTGNIGNVGLGVVAALFALLLFASNGNELLKQTVIAPGSSAEMGAEANCRADELEEEGLSLQECQLMVSSIQITLASSPDWFRPFQMASSTVGMLAAIFSFIVSFGLINGSQSNRNIIRISFSLLLLLDVSGFIAAVNTGPLLRAIYLWPLLLWFFIHLCLLVAVVNPSFNKPQQLDKG